MAVTATPYAKFLGALGRAQIDVLGNTFKVMLTTAGYVPDFDNDEFVSVVTNEITGTSYTAGGVALTGLTWTYDTTDPLNKRWVLGANPVLWSGANWTGARQLIVYVDTTDPLTSPLVGVIDYGVDKSPANEDFQQSFTAGVIRIKAA